MARRFHLAQGPAIEHLQRGRSDSRSSNRGDRARGVVDRFEYRQQRRHRFRLAQQPHRDRRRDADRSLRAHEKSGQVVAVGFGSLAAEVHDLAAGQHDLNSGDVVHGHAVHQRVRTAGVLRDVAADGAGLLAGGIGREVQPKVRDVLGELQVHHARLHDRAQVLDVDFEDAVHAREGDDHAARMSRWRRRSVRCPRRAPLPEPSAAVASRMIWETCSVFWGKTTAPGVLLRTPASYSYSIRSSGRSRTASSPRSSGADNQRRASS